MNKTITAIFLIMGLLTLPGCVSQQCYRCWQRDKHIAKSKMFHANPKIECTEKDGIIDFSIKPRQVPEIKIAECAQCGKETQNACGNCRLAFYCSEQCQKLYWWRHVVECNELRQAHFGDLECMKKACFAFFRKAVQSPNDTFYLKRGLAWFHRIHIRLRQDIACSKDPATQAALERFCMELELFVEPLMNNNICTQEDIKNFGNEVLPESIEWVARITKANELVPPFDIRIYGMRPFMNPRLNISEEFIPEKEWYKKRMDVVRRYERVLQESRSE